MLASRHGPIGGIAKAPYVCLSCRLKTKQQKRRFGQAKRGSGEAIEGNHLERPAWNTTLEGALKRQNGESRKCDGVVKPTLANHSEDGGTGDSLLASSADTDPEASVVRFKYDVSPREYEEVQDNVRAWRTGSGNTPSARNPSVFEPSFIPVPATEEDGRPSPRENSKLRPLPLITAPQGIDPSIGKRGIDTVIKKYSRDDRGETKPLFTVRKQRGSNTKPLNIKKSMHDPLRYAAEKSFVPEQVASYSPSGFQPQPRQLPDEELIETPDGIAIRKQLSFREDPGQVFEEPEPPAPLIRPVEDPTVDRRLESSLADHIDAIDSKVSTDQSQLQSQVNAVSRHDQAATDWESARKTRRTSQAAQSAIIAEALPDTAAHAQGVPGSPRDNLTDKSPPRDHSTASTTPRPFIGSGLPGQPSITPSSTNSRPGFAWQKAAMSTFVPPSIATGTLQARLYHASFKAAQQAVAVAHEDDATQSEQQPISPVENLNGIRAQLRKWQELHGHEDPMPDVMPKDDMISGDEPINNLTRLPDETALRMKSQREEEEREAFAHFADIGKEGYDGSARDDVRFLKMGDLVEIEFIKSERESMLAVYIQPTKSQHDDGQFFTMSGKWMHIPQKSVQYSIPGWISPELVKPLLAHLPDPEEVRDTKALMDQAYIEDMSVPREVSAPLVQRLVDFYNESRDIYRRNATALDNAHDILAHESDLRYGSLVSAATTLLKTPSSQLPVTALFTVRKALSNGGFAFNIDRRSHRLTGYMQIRSKEQVKTVESVRSWVRQWQEDMAHTSGWDDRQRKRHKSSKGAQHVHAFVEKAREIVLKNRENRQPTKSDNVGISKVRHPITENNDCVRIKTSIEFEEPEQEIVRFMESWCCSNMFMGLPRIEALPPLILQAVGLYEDSSLDLGTGFQFLQELGTILPYENRVRFDQHLLLPSSQHSKPLQNLMTSLLAMKDDHNFVDSMAHLRHDWKDLPVYCIDDAGAHEIDDGISIEPAGTGPDGREQHWLHVHIANPTAFFSRDHPLSKMARHMGETIYMPERTYMMLPRWATQRHFSLAPNRPALTFSTRLDADGKALERKATPSIIRNVISLTPNEVSDLIGVAAEEKTPELILTAGGNPPPRRARKTRETTEANVTQLKTLRDLSAKLANVRKQGGGVFFDSHKPDVSVWQNWRNPGLGWDHPWRRGSRTVEGDPVIQVKTRGLMNWFAGSSSVIDVMVRESMLLACETAATWCAERNIPIIYRGSVPNPARPDPALFWEENVAPVTKDNGIVPMHLGLQYIQCMGSTVLRTKPLKHSYLGMSHYAKVTSPLRRYGDMILHWQIEAALRHEAETGKSLKVDSDSKADRSFLPFSAPVLETIMMGLQPRESIITRSKNYAEFFWITMLLFRRHICNEDGGLPFLGKNDYFPNGIDPNQPNLTPMPLASAGTAANDRKPLRVYIHTQQEALESSAQAGGMIIELGTNASMKRPEQYGLPDARMGDVWEVFLEEVNVYKRAVYVRPVRLVGREGGGLL